MELTTAPRIQYAHFVNGKYTVAFSSQPFLPLNPTTGKPLRECIAIGNAQDIDRAVEAARLAFDEGPWPRMSAKERARILMRFAELIRENVEFFARIDSLNIGKLLKGCRQEALRSAENIAYFAGEILQPKNEIFYGEGEFLDRNIKTMSMVTYEPVGVVGIISPWNSPLMLGTFDIGPALALGNTCVVKPALWAPLSLMQLGKFANEAGIPEGVLNIIPGGVEAGQALVRNPRVDRISFTGSVRSGKKVGKANAETRLAPVLLEMGGKAANIVFADADLDRAVKGVALSIFRSQGQSCVAGSRLLVDHSIYKNFVESLIERTKRMKIGDPFDEKTQFGPLITSEHLGRVESFIRFEQKEAVLETGGKRPEDLDPHCARGNFLEPAIFTNVTPEMRIFQEEIFGPVLSVMPFEREEDAVELANNTEFGLSSNIWTENGERALQVANAVRAGMIWINGHFIRHHLGTPFGGMKQSGVGRKGGRWSLEFFSEPKMICIPY